MMLKNLLKSDEYVPIQQIARWFIRSDDRDFSGEAITHLKLQKLVYYAQAWFLANYDRPLCNEVFEAWAHGPANRKLFQKYRKFSWNPLPNEEGPIPKSENINVFLEDVKYTYEQYSAKKLEEMTHSELPWIEARGNLPLHQKSDKPISNLTMRNFYGEKIEKTPLKTLPH